LTCFTAIYARSCCFPHCLVLTTTQTLGTLLPLYPPKPPPPPPPILPVLVTTWPASCRVCQGGDVFSFFPNLSFLHSLVSSAFRCRFLAWRPVDVFPKPAPTFLTPCRALRSRTEFSLSRLTPLRLLTIFGPELFLRLLSFDVRRKCSSSPPSFFLGIGIFL